MRGEYKAGKSFIEYEGLRVTFLKTLKTKNLVRVHVQGNTGRGVFSAEMQISIESLDKYGEDMLKNVRERWLSHFRAQNEAGGGG